MEKVDEQWTPSGFKSTFLVDTFKDLNFKDNTKTMYTQPCGLGWRFQVVCTIQPRHGTSKSDKSFHQETILSVHFDPGVIRNTQFGTIYMGYQCSTEVSNTRTRISSSFPLSSKGMVSLGQASFLDLIEKPSIMFNVSMASIAPPAPRLQTRVTNVLRQTMNGQDLVDLKVYLFSCRSAAGRVYHPQPVYCNSSMLTGFSSDLDNLINGSGFVESALVPLGDDYPEDREEPYTDDYGYDEDEDLEDVQEAPLTLEPQTSTSSPDEAPDTTREMSSTRRTLSVRFAARFPSAAKGRQVVIRDVAFKTWKALVLYLYTGELYFVGDKTTNTTAASLRCSVKSMYRLADKLGLDDLKDIAFREICNRVTETNVVEEAFSEFTSWYPELQEAHVKYLCNRYTSAIVADALKSKMQEIIVPHGLGAVNLLHAEFGRRADSS